MRTIVRFMMVLIALLFVSNAEAGIREDWNITADAIEKLGNNNAAEQIRKSIETLSDDDLRKVYGNINLSNLANQITALEKSVNSNKQVRAEYVRLTQQTGSSPANYVSRNQETENSAAIGIESVSSYSATISNGLPSATDYPSPLWCSVSPKVFSSSDVQNFHQAVVTARSVYDGAKAIWDSANRACNQIVVALGEGANTSVACIPADVVFAVVDSVIRVAETVLEKMEMCNKTVNSAEINGSYERIGYVYSTVVADDAQIMQNISNHDADIKQVLGKHDEDIKQQITTHDADVKQRLSIHDVDMKQALSKHDEDIKNILKIVNNKLDIITERQLEIIRLLNTPDGSRSTDVPACNGGPCSFPDKSRKK